MEVVVRGAGLGAVSTGERWEGVLRHGEEVWEVGVEKAGHPKLPHSPAVDGQQPGILCKIPPPSR